jgi:hypothetical protein
MEVNELDLALEEVHQGNLESYDSVEALLNSLNAQFAIAND